MTLVFEIEYLSGVCFAALGPDSEEPDWPPQPDRVFSALVASWAARGQKEEEAEALAWLERLPPPRLLASPTDWRTAHTVYVPPNDFETPSNELGRLKWYREYLSKGLRPPKEAKLGNPRKGWMRAVGVTPQWRERKERTFPAARPHDPIVRFFWTEAEPGDDTLAALRRLAQDTAYVGHSASLTRCCFRLADGQEKASDAQAPERRVYEGRFRELRQAYVRFEKSAAKKDRPRPGARVAPPPPTPKLRANVFGERWLILEHVAGVMPDLRASALVAKALRDALLCGYKRMGLGDRIPEVVSGHAPDGRPTRLPHLAIVPLAFAGFPHADGHVLGFALVPPRESAILEEKNFREVLRTLAPTDKERERRVLTLTTKEGTPSERAFSIGLSPTFEAGRRSLDPALYLKSARTFATLTPIVLDRHLKEKGEARQPEITARITDACRNIGLPEPEVVVADKHSALEGAPSAYPSGRSPAWMGWRRPRALESRSLTHAVLRFVEPVEGPVILGCGRFVGLGLCRPLDGGRR